MRSSAQHLLKLTSHGIHCCDWLGWLSSSHDIQHMCVQHMCELWVRLCQASTEASYVLNHKKISYQEETSGAFCLVTEGESSGHSGV